MNPEEFQNDPRSYALDLVDEGMVSGRQMLLACLNYLSYEDVREMLSLNELDPESHT